MLQLKMKGSASSRNTGQMHMLFSDFQHFNTIRLCIWIEDVWLIRWLQRNPVDSSGRKSPPKRGRKGSPATGDISFSKDTQIALLVWFAFFHTLIFSIWHVAFFLIYSTFRWKWNKSNPTASIKLHANFFKIFFAPIVARYNPFGRPGAGAPLRDNSGRIIAVLLALFFNSTCCIKL